jgi:dienelactone hydrolase
VKPRNLRNRFRLIAGLLTAAALSLSVPAQAQPDDSVWLRPVSNYPERLSVSARYVIDRYEQEDHPLALVVAPDGGYATYWRCNGPDCRLDDAVYVGKALRLCEERAHIGQCLVYAIRDRVLWPTPPVFDTEIRSKLIVPWKFSNKGAEAAKGVILHVPGYAGHRYPPTLDHPVAPYYLRKLNQTGYDVLRLNIAHFDYGSTDFVELGEKLRDVVSGLRKGGYDRVFLNGQSRGAWEILSASAKGLGIDGAMLFVPAAHGRPERWDGSVNRRHASAQEDFATLMANAGEYPFLFAFFEGDQYDPGGRIEALNATAKDEAEPTRFVLHHPVDLAGHGAAGRIAFHSIYGPCLERFLDSREVDFAECRTMFALTGERQAATEEHLIGLGGIRLQGVSLMAHLLGRAFVPTAGNGGWWGYHLSRSGDLLQWFPGDYLTGNTLRATWEAHGDNFCVRDSRRLNSNNYCYGVYLMPSGNTGLVAPDGLAFVVRSIRAETPEDLPFRPGDWMGEQVSDD